MAKSPSLILCENCTDTLMALKRKFDIPISYSIKKYSLPRTCECCCKFNKNVWRVYIKASKYPEQMAGIVWSMRVLAKEFTTFNCRQCRWLNCRTNNSINNVSNFDRNYCWKYEKIIQFDEVWERWKFKGEKYKSRCEGFNRIDSMCGFCKWLINQGYGGITNESEFQILL